MRFYATKPEFFPYTTLFRSGPRGTDGSMGGSREGRGSGVDAAVRRDGAPDPQLIPGRSPPHPRLSALPRSEEHTSELQSRGHLVCRLLLEKKKTKLSRE